MRKAKKQDIRLKEMLFKKDKLKNRYQVYHMHQHGPLRSGNKLNQLV